uniref:Uncharacterized protein n=1 Tax=Anopheles funestus TaxID=62324 RepID=A0A4Y0BGF2_ANOFN
MPSYGLYGRPVASTSILVARFCLVATRIIMKQMLPSVASVGFPGQMEGFATKSISKNHLWLADDVVGDDESSWHDRVSSGFDRLVAFASTELDKTRRSNEDVPPSSASCTTSPDSGINQSDHSRTFLSSSSSSSQLDVPPSSASVGSSSSSSISSSSSNSSTSSIGSVTGGHGVGHGQHVGSGGNTVVAGGLMLKHMVPIIKSSPAEPVDSPPLSDVGLPRTPSPTSSPPLLFGHPTAISSTIVGGGNSAAVLQPAALLHPPGNGGGGNNGAPTGTVQPGNNSNSLGIPLKYQRQSKSSSASSEKHYKKKFRERNWEEYEESLSGGRNSAISVGEPMEQQDYAAVTVASAAAVGRPHRPGSSHNVNILSTDSNPAASATAMSTEGGTTRGDNGSDHQLQHQQVQQHHHKHKSAKFRPKGKDWNWDDEHSNASSGSATSSTRTSRGSVGGTNTNPT